MQDAATWAEAFRIFAEHQTASNGFNVHTEHDEVWIGLDDTTMLTDEQVKRVDELGWSPDGQGGFNQGL